MRRSSPTRWAAAAALVSAVAAMAARRTAATDPEPEPQPDSGTTMNDVRQDPDKVLDYWTPERMKEAGNAPMPKRD
ncbi:hypothetical protein [Wenjunlia tyrosinilytica]|uniref:Uncharacterized protein n=1 Tax=Wenjunlia tyrosinilytica TaxID=1544741 RepID=A0A917ZVP8_9ACTN|nr:hypothetical protein [Wenjunlia tyrosinilytica]GGO96651.1 hypothetical protein GCM10012280_56640 [Wenjunlia tyrosinilytica]